MSSSAPSHPPRHSLLAELCPLRVRVISEEPVVRAGIRCLLESCADNVAFVEDGADVDVLLYDVIGLRQRGSHDLEHLVQMYPGRVLALARFLQPGLTARALELGATAAVPLGAEPDELVEAVRDLFDGRFEDGSAADVANRIDRDLRLGTGVCLSPRERQVISLIVGGASNHE